MSGEHSIHVRLDAMSPRWSHQYYRYEHHFNFRLPSEDAVTAAVELIAELCEELRNPVQDAVPESAAAPSDQPAATWGTSEEIRGKVSAALYATEKQLGPVTMGETDFDQRLGRAMLFLNYLGQQDG